MPWTRAEVRSDRAVDGPEPIPDDPGTSHRSFANRLGGQNLRDILVSLGYDVDIALISGLSLKPLAELLKPFERWTSRGQKQPEKALVTERIVCDLLARLEVLLDLGLGYLSLDRSTPTLSPGELQNDDRAEEP